MRRASFLRAARLAGLRAALLTGGIVVATSALPSAQGAPDDGDLAALLARVAESVRGYYARAQSIMCLETVRLQSLGVDLLSDAGAQRRLDYDLRIAWDPPVDGEPPEATVRRQLVKVNGRPPKPKDEPGCMDPKDVSPEPLSMFLPDGQAEFAFKIAGTGKIGGRRAVLVDFKSREAGEATMSVKDDCLSFELPGRARGRVWIDAETDLVLRLDTHLTGMFDFMMPREQRHMGGPLSITIERYDSSIVYKPVTFENPEEQVLLPASITTVSVIRNSGAPRMRTTQEFSKYQRFITGGRIVQQ